MNKAIFLDRDGVINKVRKESIKSWSEFEFIPGILEFLSKIAELDCYIFIVTNQSLVGRGVIEEEVLQDIHKHMLNVIEENGGRIDAIYECIHKAEDNCVCRKPKPGMILWARRQYGLDLSKSVMIGDSESDKLTAENAGCKFISIKEGIDLWKILKEKIS